MKKTISFLLLILIWACGSLCGAENLPYSNTISPKYIKRSGPRRRIMASVHNGADKACNANLTPKIHQGIWPDFCIHHLQNNPEGCSAWRADKQNNLQLNFTLHGHSECQIDRELLNRLGHLIYLIPQKSLGYKGRCDYAWCPKCSQTVIRALSCYEEEDGNEIYFYTYFPVYKCECTGAWWLDLDDLWDEECDIYEGWQFCKSPTIYRGYSDWHHQSYFHDLKVYLTYLEENPACDCYWPQVNAKAKKISDLDYIKLLNVLDTSNLDDIRNCFTPYLIGRSQHGFLSGLLTHAFFYSHYRDILLDLDQHSFKQDASDYSKIHSSLIDVEELLQKPFYHLYTQCLTKHPHPKIYYERGMVLFHRGDNLDSLDDIRRFMAYAKKHQYQEFLTSDLYLKEGRLLSESLSYDEAIIALTKAIEKDPKNAEAYFERAFAYFEIGNFEKALSDYLVSGIHPKKIGKLNYITLSQGIALGMLQGGQDSVTEFVPLVTIKLDVKFNDHEISRYGSPKIGTVSSYSSIAIWTGNIIHAELLKTKYYPLPPSHMKVAYSWAYLWRVKPKKNLSFLTFECFLDPKQPIINKDIETGEGLFSKNFSFGEEFIYIGTEDEDRLFQRANANNGLSSRYVKEKEIGYDIHNLVEPSDLGIKVHLPPLKAGELAQLQFVIAGGTDRTANWFAVDAHPKDILLQAGCK